MLCSSLVLTYFSKIDGKSWCLYLTALLKVITAPLVRTTAIFCSQKSCLRPILHLTILFLSENNLELAQ